jgi:hypothetical protein
MVRKSGTATTLKWRGRRNLLEQLRVKQDVVNQGLAI